MSIVLLRGFSQSGKDYIGHILSKEYGYTRFAFADSLKKLVSRKYNCPLDKLHSQTGKLEVCQLDTHKCTYRQLLIDEALYLRNQDIDIFARLCAEDIKQQKIKNVVITDWRYDNEIEVIMKSFPSYKVIPVKVIRKGQHQSPVNDISEYQLINRIGDYELHNNIDDTIYENIEYLIKYINEK